MNLRAFQFAQLWLLFLSWGMTGCHLMTLEPNYQGKGLSAWLRDFEDNEQPEKHAMAAEAIRHMGGEAVPFLVERLSESRWKQFKQESRKWSGRQSGTGLSAGRLPNPRLQALAGLDALCSEAEGALPALEKLLHESPPNPQVLYVVARIGQAGVPLLTKSLASKEKVLRLEARVCLGMMASHSETLYPPIPVGADAPSLTHRLCEFNLKVLQAAAQEYAKEHPEMQLPGNGLVMPPPSRPPP